MAYTTIDKPSDYFNTILWTGNDTDNRIISGVGFSPNWSWIKARNNADAHYLIDTVRGSTKVIFSDSTSSEQTRVSAVKAFYQEGYILGQEAQVNRNGGTFVSWNWKAGTSFTNDASSTGVGSIDSAGSVSTDAGFSIVAWNGNDGTIAHGLGVKPAMIIIKSRQTSNNWVVFHKGLGTMSAASNSILILNGTAAKDDPGAGFAEPTTSVFTIKGGAAANDNNIGYLFAEKQGYSKFGSYTGNNNANGPFVNLGFKPARVMVKKYSATNHWIIWDNKRGTRGGNIIDKKLYANLNNAENGNDDVSFLSNGFKLHTNTGDWNEAESYVYMAFAENPFTTSTGIPATAG